MRIRYYWDDSIGIMGDCRIQQVTAEFIFAHGYLGASFRLVITPPSEIVLHDSHRRIPLGTVAGGRYVYKYLYTYRPLLPRWTRGLAPQDSASSKPGYESQASSAKLFTVSRFDPASSAPLPPPASPEGGRDDIWIEGRRGGSAGGRSIRPSPLPMPAGRGGSEGKTGTEAAGPCDLRANANEEAARPCDVRANVGAKHSSEICAPSTSSTDLDLEPQK